MRGDEGFDDVYQREYPIVFRAAFVLCGDRAAAEDATQDAFAKALARWNRLQGEPWVARWLTTTALNAVRRNARKANKTILASFTGSEELKQDRDGNLDVWATIRALPERQREAVVLYYIADLPISQVAIGMGCQEGTVKAHLAKARATLRHHLEGAGYGA